MAKSLGEVVVETKQLQEEQQAKKETEEGSNSNVEKDNKEEPKEKQ